MDSTERAPGAPDDTARTEEDGLGAAATAWSFGGPDYLAYRVLLLAKMIDRQSTEVLQREAGLSLAEWRSLANLALFQPASVRTIAENAWVDRAEVSRAFAGLERRGLVARTENPRDRRSPTFSLTEAGRELVGRISPLRRAFHQSLVEALSETERAALERGLRILAERCVAEMRVPGAA